MDDLTNRASEQLRAAVLQRRALKIRARRKDEDPFPPSMHRQTTDGANTGTTESPVKRPITAVGMKTKKPWPTSGTKDVLVAPEHGGQHADIILDRLGDYNPDASLALIMAKRLAFRGYGGVTAVDENGEPFEEAQRYLDEMEGRCFGPYCGSRLSTQGTAGDRWKVGAEVGVDATMRHGGVGIETELLDDLETVKDLHFVPRELVDWRLNEDGQVVPVYLRNGNVNDPIEFHPLQFSYAAHLPKAAYPHGQSFMLPALETGPNQHDWRKNLKRVADSHAFSRIKNSVDTDRCRAFGEALGYTGDELAEFVDGIIEDVADDFEDMYTDDVWTVLDFIQSDVLGASHSTHSLKPLEMKQAFDEDHLVALNTQPALHGRSYGSELSSTGSVQWQVYALMVEGYREPAVRAMEEQMTLALRLRGFQATAKFEFEPLRKEDVVDEARALLMRMQAAGIMIEHGIRDREQIAMDEFGEQAPTFEPIPIEEEGQIAEAENATTLSLNGNRPSSNGHQATCVHCTDCHIVLDSAVDAGRLGEPLCPDCYTEAMRREAFVPSNVDVASVIEMVQDSSVGLSDLDRAIRDWDKRARRVDPPFVGIHRGRVDHA